MLPIVLAAAALAGPLDDYAGQKHTDRDKVTKEGCQPAYIERCLSECDDGDQECEEACEEEAPRFCEERKKRKRRKTAEVVAKGASVGAGAGAVALQNAIVKRRSDGAAEVEREPDPFDIYWFRTTVLAEAGGGVFAGPIGVGTGHARLRWAWFGLAGTTTWMGDGTSTLSETDLGPTFSLHSPNLVFTAQPSLLVSHYRPGEEPDDPTFEPTELGGGLRSYTTLHLHQLTAHLDPMLGLVDGQWSYHLRLGLGYRLTPAIFARVSYDYRDVVDLTDLDISSASLQGVVVTVGARLN